MSADTIAYAENACSTEVALSSAAVATDATPQLKVEAACVAPGPLAVSRATSDGQQLRYVRGREEDDPLAYALGLLQRIKAADARLREVCDAITSKAAAAPGTFAGGFTAGLGNGLYAAARGWLSSQLDLAKSVWGFFADTPLESTLALLVRGLATAVALELSKKEQDIELLQQLAVMLSALAVESRSDDQLGTLLLVTSAQLAAVAEWMQMLRAARFEDTLLIGLELSEAVVDYCVSEMQQAASGGALELGLGFGEMVGRCIGEISLLALGV